MTGEVDRATIIRLLEAASGDLATACANAGRPLPGFQELMQALEKEGDQTVALFQAMKGGEIFSIYTDGSVSRLIGCQIHKDARDSRA